MTDILNVAAKRYLITGAASGIGKATAILLSKLGANLILVDIDGDGLENTKSEICGVECECVKINLAESHTIKSSVMEATERFGKVNGLAHIAGIPYIAPLKAVKSEKAELLYKVNQYACIELSKAFQSKKVYEGNGGSVVFVSSVYGLVGSPANVAYAMTKAAVVGITKALAMEFVSKNIRVNCIAPGFIKTNMMENNSFRFDEDYLVRLNALHPLGLGEAVDIANGIIYLLSDMSKWVTGTVLNVDGGFTAQ